ncbi:carbohydrate kinase family protein [Nonomuraea sp. NPDC050783]|uniref:carbohydrate kinase family protein n=1 Tax=Nonomuraea sp. NPDC050783 TaxID=3154634 RepID=UPI0034671385
MSAFPAGLSVLVVGDYYLDLVFAGLPRWPQPGEEVFGTQTASLPGGAFTHQRALHRLGVPAAWAAELGNDPYSRLTLDTARAEGLDTTAYLLRSSPVRNLTVAMSHAGERGFVSFREPLPPRDVTDVVLARRPACVLLTELTVGPRLAAVDIFAPNAAEARRLTGHDDVHVALDRLRALTPTVVIKNGPHGAIAADPTGRVATTAEAVSVCDTIGAGDCFDAGFVAGHLYGLGLADSTALATLCGTLSVTGQGGAAAPTLAQLAERAPALVPWATTSPPHREPRPAGPSR